MFDTNCHKEYYEVVTKTNSKLQMKSIKGGALILMMTASQTKKGIRNERSQCNARERKR